ncbi:MAG: class I SAM-dependent methyltransferase [Candidatus Omnitrophica bacterium]|nr:class I SAM-dependent methyltransferase [Candidatus Omnitrophota bacterium]
MSEIRKTRRLYRNLGYVTVFIYFRFFHAPYDLAETLVPRQGKIMDLGCGYGFFANLLGLASKKRDVMGVEFSDRKLQYADQGVENVRFINEDITKLTVIDCDAIILFHVLHHLHSHNQQQRLLKEAYKKLKKGGKLIVVEIDNKPLWKFLFTVAIDATLYIGNWFYYRTEKQFIELFERLDFTVEKIVPAHRFVPLSHKIYVCRK